MKKNKLSTLNDKIYTPIETAKTIMNNYTDEFINEYEVPPVTKDKIGKIITLNFKSFINTLMNRQDHTIKTPALIECISTLGKNKSGSNNSIGRLQYFINAYFQEIALATENPSVLEFINDDHTILTRNNPGSNAADFKLNTDEITFTVEVKKYWSKDSYEKNLPYTNFHNADYALVYLIEEKVWRFSKKSELYRKLYSIEALAKTDPWLIKIKLPTKLTSIKFYVDNNATDNEVPEKVSYSFYNK